MPVIILINCWYHDLLIIYSIAIKRILREAQQITSDPAAEFVAAPLEVCIISHRNLQFH